MIPEGWIKTTLSEATVLNPKRTWSHQKIRFCEMAAVDAEEKRICYLLDRDTPKSGSKFKNGDFLLARISPCAENGKMALVDVLDDGEIGAGSTEFLVFEGKAGVLDPHYLFHIMNWDKVRGRYLFRMEGTSGRQRIPKEVFDEIDLSLPPISEQSAIVEVLGSIIEVQRRTRSTLTQTRRLKQALLHQLLTKGIDENGRPHTRFKKTEIGEIPEAWEVVELPDLVAEGKHALTAGPFGTIFKAKDFRETGVPIIQIRHIGSDGFDWGKKTTFMDEEVYNKVHQPYSVFPGDLLITKMGEPPGLACVYPSGAEVAMVTPDVIKATIGPRSSSKFLSFVYSSSYMRRKIEKITMGGTRSRVSLDSLYRIPIPLPKLPEQARIEKILSALEERIEAEIRAQGSLTKMQLSASSDLLSGRVRVKDLKL